MRYVNNYMTIASNSLSFHFQKHPHLRGENGTTTAHRLSSEETSPPAWGKRGPTRLGVSSRGNIPTCVGKTDGGSRCGSSRRKHPHLRGENAASVRVLFCPVETSPPAWGKPNKKYKGKQVLRNIPTCVGKTIDLDAFNEDSRKHPHLRGENSAHMDFRSSERETSPPAWGKPHPLGGREARGGNIPTCVGKTGVSRTSTPPA